MGRPRKGNKAPRERTLSRNNEQGGNWNVVNMTNETFNKYYKAQGIIPESEWDDFINAFRQPLPTTFRLTSSRPTAHALNQHIKDVYVPFLTGLEYEGTKLSPPKPLQWYPDQLAWQLPVPKSALRKNENMRKFQHFLVYETDAGNLSRQEAVSMIPPLLLDVQPGHTALDMCAAPGSKSVQILEALHGHIEGAQEGDAKVPQGLLIANDSDAKRCHLLVHQSLHRVPGTGMMVTNHDASQLPSLRLAKDSKTWEGKLKFTQDEENRLSKRDKAKVAEEYDSLLFDRILTDVPCSGDGTIRKNLGIWGDWTPGNGIGLHSLQLRILLRAIQLLKPGGRLVYSTCSMSPMENEAVVSAALHQCPEMSILAVPDELPGLIRRPGMTSWQVLDNNLNPAPHPDAPEATAEDAPEPPSAEEVIAVEQDNDKGREGQHKGKHPRKGSNRPNDDAKGGRGGARKSWSKTLWPVGDEKELGLEHCLRLYPHLQDTGAFFVCVLVKKADEEVSASTTTTATENAGAATEEEQVAPPAAAAEKRERASSPSRPEGEPEAKKVKQQDGEVAVAPASEMQVDAASASASVSAASTPKPEAKKEHTLGAGRPFNEEPYIYLPGLEDEQVQLIKDFFDISDDFPFNELLVRNATGVPLRSIYLTSHLTRGLLLSNAYTRMRLISCGVKLFTRQESSKEQASIYRCKWRLNSEGLEVVKPFLGEKRIVTVNEATLRQCMEEVSVKFEDLKEEGLEARLRAMEPGSAVLRVENAKGKDLQIREDMHLAFWISKSSCNLMVEKVDKSALSLRLYDEDVTPHSKAKQAEAAAAKATKAATSSAADAASGSATPAASATETEAEAAKVEATELAEKEETGVAEASKPE
ncbi:hypothetical protein C6P46_002835 [Rhodotorula mucilaginosa]|uniref:SAM-dependent MTase RsmB/NOP-type domain-containing protein n=1 Tax=Rhodotorula mucilaginosa TaxID=5537 RepID=A0A9P6W352_RHOMI|nr:hypothetical protein C6P46_002835 [Rhodotorula mucilaginosa]TKA52325.1 hypothetical protein B0A53_04793 [Rhodotorula sp. CCFEE 5036]